jgi:hypothetical protein
LTLIKPVLPRISEGQKYLGYGVSTYTTQLYRLRCHNCGQTGGLWITEDGQRDWSFATVGFIGLAVNRHNPRNSVLRCNACGSPQVRLEFGDQAEKPNSQSG